MNSRVLTGARLEFMGEGTGLAHFYAQSAEEPFTLIDIGCSNGIDPRWRLFESKLRVVAFDADVAECDRLRQQELDSNIEYIAAYIGSGSRDAPTLSGKTTFLHRSPWDRLAIAKSQVIRKTRGPAHKETLADRSSPLHLGSFFRKRGLRDIDFIKIDVDGPDFEILQSIKDDITELNVLSIVMEVNWVGSDDPTDHTFHNTDRFMRALGFDLFGFTRRPYSAAALPCRYVHNFPSQSIRGRALQGDALYMRDMAAPGNRAVGVRYSRDKLLKLAVLYDLFGLPDHAAELLIAYEDVFGGRAAITPILDFLVKFTGVDFGEPVSYREFIDRFEADDSAFYTPPFEGRAPLDARTPDAGESSIGQRLRTAHNILKRLAGR